MPKTHTHTNRCAQCLEPLGAEAAHLYCADCRRARNPDGVRYPHCYVQLVGKDGNAYAIMGRMQAELRRHMKHDLDWPRDKVVAELACYQAASTEGDYNHLLRTAMAWANEPPTCPECGGEEY